MNWTAILALLGLPALVGYLGWQLRQASADALESALLGERMLKLTREACLKSFELGTENERLKADLAAAKALARRRQSRTGQRAGETVSLESVRDPDFTGGLDPVEYLNRLHAGVGDHDKDCACAECLECRPARARSTSTGNTTDG